MATVIAAEALQREKRPRIGNAVDLGGNRIAYTHTGRVAAFCTEGAPLVRPDRLYQMRTMLSSTQQTLPEQRLHFR